MVKIALFQSQTGIDPAANAALLADAVGRTAEGGAAMLFTPEMSGLLDRDADRAAKNVRLEENDEVLAAVRDAAHKHGIWVHIGSLAVRTEGAPARQPGIRRSTPAARSVRATTRSICSTSTFRPARAGAKAMSTGMAAKR